MQTTIAQQIHGAVNEASDLLLKENPFNLKNVQALLKMGFTRSENVLDYEDHSSNHKRAREYYIKYPQYKFITEHQLDKVRKKYNLTTESVDRFLGEIPDKNIQEMINCRIELQDVQINFFRRQRGDVRGRSEFFSNPMDPFLSAMFPSASLGTISARQEQKTSTHSLYNRTPFMHFEENARKRDIQGTKIPHPSYKGPVSLTQLYHDKDFRDCVNITAPPDLFARPVRELDPIVTVSVKGGHLIITAWGAEASDPDVINAKMN